MIETIFFFKYITRESQTLIAFLYIIDIFYEPRSLHKHLVLINLKCSKKDVYEYYKILTHFTFKLQKQAKGCRGRRIYYSSLNFEKDPGLIVAFNHSIGYDQKFFNRREDVNIYDNFIS